MAIGQVYVPSHPMYDTGVRKPVQPPKPMVKVPDREMMDALLANGADAVVAQLIEQHKMPLKIENGKLVDALKGTDLYLNRFITQDEVCLQIKKEVPLLAKCPDPVLITGETGTGKEIIARAMIGDRSGTTIAVNCAGMPEHLIESELFGHERGAFTGADSAKQGLTAAARDGVLFLDEVGEFPLGVQGKLLRAIQDMKIRRVGSNKEEDINCKFVCATHRNLKEMVKAGTFREDLYARLSVFEIHIPPLRERIDDVELIIRNEQGGNKLLDTMKAADKRVSDLDLSLNVRAIQRAVRRFVVYGRVILS